MTTPADPPPPFATLGAALRLLREALDPAPSVETVADALGLPVRYLERLEVGWARPRRGVLEELCAHYGITFDDLLAGRLPPARPTQSPPGPLAC